MKTRIRHTSDVALIKRLHSLTFPKDEWIDEYEENKFTVVEVDGHVAGFTTCRPLRDTKSLYLERIGVLRKYSHLGLARRLIRFITRWASRCGYDNVITYVLTSNGPSLASFFRAGYRVYSPLNPWGGNTAVYFRKDLCPKRS